MFDSLQKEVAKLPSTPTKFSADDADLSKSSVQLRSVVREVRDTGASETSNRPGSQEKPLERPSNVDGGNTGASKRTSKRHVRDLSYFFDDGRLGKRQPIDRIDEPNEWRDRYRILAPRIERQSIVPIFAGRTFSRYKRALSDGMTRTIHIVDSFWQ